MARRTKEEAQETRCRILDTAEHVFFEKGVSRTSLTDIAVAAGVTRGAIYWHFRNKSDLFEAMFARIKMPFEELIEATIDLGEPDPLQRMRDVLMLVFEGTASNPQRARVLDILYFKCEFTEDMGVVLSRHTDAMRDARHKMAAGLRNAVAKGQLPHDLDADRAAVMLHGFLNGMLADWLLTPDQIDLARKASTYIDALFDMLHHSPALRLGAIGEPDAMSPGVPPRPSSPGLG
ncbi:TetR family transcriptional regulator [Pararobbsia silviterrae]|uniref:TetR family transcriptional regulator n=1 Tax=Pararobbsia silviterrae TaxID=1792498 RepID=A0A494Y8L2_9BURK|nr:TetR family transcriptional regulator [Pararobbsia silviterrae]RKP59011.1 TetR family transcriptional regulator [Pararobbsia silviterrae]